MDSLKSSRSKLRRAGDHLASLDRELRQFLADHKYQVVREHDLQQGLDVMRMKIAGTPPLPDNIGHLIGEFATALRASLDHLTVACAIMPKNPKKVEFPIFDKAEGFAEKTSAKKIDSLPAGAQREIERLQPYHATQPHSHPLWRIHRLSNTDKHRHVAVVPFGFMHSCRGPTPGTRIGMTITLAENLSEDPKMPILPIPEAMQMAFDFKVEPTFAIVLANADEDTGIFMQLSELPTLHDFVRDKVFPAIEGFAP